MEYKFERTRLNKIPRDKIVTELEHAAKVLNYVEFGWRDFNKVANITRSPVVKEFGSWKKAIDFLREHLKNKGITLKERKIRYYSDGQLFAEMDRIWKLLGQRPSRTQWESSEPKISYNCYKKRFSGWTNACLKFIEYKMGRSLDDNVVQIHEISKDKEDIKQPVKAEEKRVIPLKLRLDVLSRDKFRCVFCGKSPATDLGTILHIDHIIPFSKGGKTNLNNLQTLCSDCNIGKSARENIKQ